MKKSSSKPKNNWWVLLITGLLSCAVGIMGAFQPIESFLGIAVFINALILVSGLAHLFLCFSDTTILNWGWYFTMSILEIFLGAALLCYPQLTLMTLPIFIGVWMLFKGSAMISLAVELRRMKQTGWGTMMGLGILALIFAMLILLYPSLGAIYLVISISAALLAYGIFAILLSFRIKKSGGTIDNIM